LGGRFLKRHITSPICFGDGTFFVLAFTDNSIQTEKSIHVQKVKLSALFN
jgi:hypothetical protein